MATLPTPQETERVILDVFKNRGARPGEPIMLLDALNPFMVSRNYSAADFNQALRSMGEKGWIVEVRGGQAHSLTEAGYTEV